ncbi:MAG: RagB/SusD family nutrient uptake outer membrane protein [Bacteroidales bacterium]
MKRKIGLISTILIYIMTSCADLDIAPPNIITDDNMLSSEAGMKIYMARMYSQMPWEDFKFRPGDGFTYSSWLMSLGVEGTGVATHRDGIASPYRGDGGTPLWQRGLAFELLRDANYLIENFPDYKGNFADITYNHFLGEAYFVRAFVFTQMAKRYGGVQLVTETLDIDSEDIPRSSEKETWDQILADFDMAIGLLQSKSPVKGYSNKFVALSYKSDAMLYAGSVAKYNETLPNSGDFGLGRKTGIRVIGFAEDEWRGASIKYLTEAYKSAREVMKDGGYSLYKAKWVASDKEAQYQNLLDMLTDPNSSENIYVREYQYPTITHGYNAYNFPFQMKGPTPGGCPTLDFVELFDGLGKRADGSIPVTTGNTNAEGQYLYFDSPLDLFKNAEPRLRAMVIFPGDQFNGEAIDVRAGVYKGTPTGVFPVGKTYNEASIGYQTSDWGIGGAKPTELLLSATGAAGDIIELADGTTMKVAGASGPWYDNGETCLTGFYTRKYLYVGTQYQSGLAEGMSDQPYILFRYAEVMLNAAEAGIELSLAGEALPDKQDASSLATEIVQSIQERAGATIQGVVQADEVGRNIVRKERRKELAFEHKSMWDLRRWRVQHQGARNLFWGLESDFELKSTDGNNSYRFRGLYPFYSTEQKKYFFDERFQWLRTKTFTYAPVDYYFEVPPGEVAKSSVVDQQPNR